MSIRGVAIAKREATRRSIFLDCFALLAMTLNEILIIKKMTNKVEKIKKDSRGLRGGLQESLSNQVTGALAADDQVIVKFHGSYQQDDRDSRARRAQKKLEKLYSFMLRLRISGGKITGQQWLGIHKIADNNANETIKITTRQTVQLHGIIKSKLKPTIASFYKDFDMDSISACGDVNRNVMVSTAVEKNAAYAEVFEFGKKISDYLLPKSKAYHEIWIDDEKISGAPTETQKDDLYGDTYLPRKFKIVLAIPPHNDVDVYAHDIGLVAIIEDEILKGFNVIVGGGMGRVHGNENTFARVGDLVGFVKKEKILDAVYQIAAIQRDFGNREERAVSRFKYTIARNSKEWFVEKFEEYFGEKLSPARDFELKSRDDQRDWHKDYLDKNHLLLFVEHGRVTGAKKQALFEIADAGLANFRFTNNQNIIISEVLDENKAKITKILTKNGVLEEKISPIRFSSMACVALNTCSLALAEGQRYLPTLVTEIEELLAKHGLTKDAISIRMTGCPNGCARPYLAEVALIGKALGKYDLHLGGDRLGERLNILYKESLGEEDILSELDEKFSIYVKNKKESESFGDYLFFSAKIFTVPKAGPRQGENLTFNK